MGDERFNYSGKLEFLRRICVDPRLQRTAVAVASVIVDHADRRSGVAYPSVARIVTESGVPKSTALRAIRRLEETGWVTSDRRMGALTHYRLTGPEAGTGSEFGTGANWNATGAIQNLRRGKTGPDGDTKVVPMPGPKQKSSKATGIEQRTDASRPVDPIWGTGLQFLQSKGVGEKDARGYLGRLIKVVGPIQARALLAQAEDDDVIAPIAWLAKAAAIRSRRNAEGGRLARDRRTEDEIASANEEALARLGATA